MAEVFCDSPEITGDRTRGTGPIHEEIRAQKLFTGSFLQHNASIVQDSAQCNSLHLDKRFAIEEAGNTSS